MAELVLMKKSIFTLSALAIVALLIVIKVFVIDKDKKSIQAPPSKQPPALVTVTVVKPASVSNTIVITGDVIANEEVELRPEANGKIVKINFTEGGNVRKGQLLVKINDADLQANLRKLKAQLKLAEEKRDRLQKLLDINGVSKEDYDVAVNSAQSLQSDIDYTLAEIAKTEIYAPFDGVIGLKNISEGNYATPTSVIATIQQLNPLKIDFSVPERYASQVKTNTDVVFTTGTYKDEYKAKIYAIEPKIDPATRSLKVRALYNNNTSGKVFPGAFAQVKIGLNEDVASFLVPTQALVPAIRGSKAYVVKQGKVKFVDVETGMRNDSTVQVISGLYEGDSLVVTGVMSLRDEMNVVVKGVRK